MNDTEYNNMVMAVSRLSIISVQIGQSEEIEEINRLVDFAQGYLRALEEFKVMPQDVIAEMRIACLNRAAERMLELNRRKKHE